MMTWTLKLRWLLFLNWSPQEGFLETSSDIGGLASRGYAKKCVQGEVVELPECDGWRMLEVLKLGDDDFKSN